MCITEQWTEVDKFFGNEDNGDMGRRKSLFNMVMSKMVVGSFFGAVNTQLNKRRSWKARQLGVKGPQQKCFVADFQSSVRLEI